MKLTTSFFIFIIFIFYKALHPRFHGENLDKNKTIYSRIERLARKHQCTPAQLALAWVFKQGDDIAPIPGNWLSFFGFFPD